METKRSVASLHAADGWRSQRRHPPRASHRHQRLLRFAARNAQTCTRSGPRPGRPHRRGERRRADDGDARAAPRIRAPRHRHGDRPSRDAGSDPALASTPSRAARRERRRAPLLLRRPRFAGCELALRRARPPRRVARPRRHAPRCARHPRQGAAAAVQRDARSRRARDGDPRRLPQRLRRARAGQRRAPARGAAGPARRRGSVAAAAPRGSRRARARGDAGFRHGVRDARRRGEDARRVLVGVAARAARRAPRRSGGGDVPPRTGAHPLGDAGTATRNGRQCVRASPTVPRHARRPRRRRPRHRRGGAGARRRHDRAAGRVGARAGRRHGAARGGR